MQDSPNPSKAAIRGLAGPSLACSSSSFKAHARRCYVWEAAHGHGTWGARLKSWAMLGSTAPSREALPCAASATDVHHGLSRKELKKGTKSCGLHILSTRLDNVEPEQLISHVLMLPQTCCWMCGPALRDPQHVWGKKKLSRTKQNKTWECDLGF